jgi:hypothetical protein
MGKVYKFTRGQLKTENASNFKQGDMIIVGNYLINIIYKSGGRTRTTPTLESGVEDYSTFKACDCTPGVRGGRPYYIDDFLHR